jgi:HD superfamily phosphodiesterase
MWSRRPESARFALGDLMVWNAWRRRAATKRVAEQTHMLGFDLEGRYAGHDRVPLDQQLAIAREISHALEMKSAYSRHHSRRVERHVRRMAAALGLAHEDTEQLAVAAELHDIGNIQIPEHLLSKPGLLTEIEREAIEGHVALGAAMAFTAGSTEVVEAIRHHHERWDGSGYPNGLVGEEIPLFARMIAIAEAYDAMTSPRPYRRSFTRDQAVQLLRDQSGVQFDPMLTDLFVDSMHEQSAAAFAPLLVLPWRFTRDFFSGVQRMGNGSVAALVGGATALVLLGTAIVAPGTFDLPSNFAPPDVSRGVAAPITMSLDAPEPEAETDGEREQEAIEAAATLPTDVVLGTRFHNDPPGPTHEPPGSDPSPGTPSPSPSPDPVPPVVSPPGIVGPPLPGIGGHNPTPGTDIPDDVRDKGKKPKKNKGPQGPKGSKGSKDKNPNANGNGHAYGHDRGDEHPGNSHPAGNTYGHGDDPGRGNATGHDKDDKDKGKGGNDGSGDDATGLGPGVPPATISTEDAAEDDGTDE